MSKILILLLTIFTVVPVTSAQEPSNFFVSSADNLLCSDVLPSNSVVAPFVNVAALNLEDVQRNDNVNLPIRVTNSNPFPIQNINVHLRLFKVANNDNQPIAPQLHTTQVINEDLTLAGGESLEFNHSITIPTNLTNGVYHYSTYVESNQRFPLSGTSAYQTNLSQDLAFTLAEGQPYGSIIDRASVQVNNTDYTFSGERVSVTGSSTLAEITKPTPITVTVKNVSGSGPTIGTFSWKIFMGNQPNPVTLIDAQEVPIKLVPGTQTEVKYELTNPKPMDYTVVGTLNTKNNSNQTVVLSFNEDGSVIARPTTVDPIDFSTFVRNSHDENSTELLFCYTPEKILQYENPKLEFTVAGTAGEIGEYVLDLSDAPYSRTSMADRFSFPTAPGSYTVDVTLSSADTVVSTSTVQYVHESAETQITPTENKNNSTALAVVAGLLFGLLIFGLLFYRRSFTKLEN